MEVFTFPQMTLLTLMKLAAVLEIASPYRQSHRSFGSKTHHLTAPTALLPWNWTTDPYFVARWRRLLLCLWLSMFPVLWRVQSVPATGHGKSRNGPSSWVAVVKRGVSRLWYPRLTRRRTIAWCFRRYLCSWSDLGMSACEMILTDIILGIGIVFNVWKSYDSGDWSAIQGTSQHWTRKQHFQSQLTEHPIQE